MSDAGSPLMPSSSNRWSAEPRELLVAAGFGDQQVDDLFEQQLAAR